MAEKRFESKIPLFILLVKNSFPKGLGLAIVVETVVKLKVGYCSFFFCGTSSSLLGAGDSLEGNYFAENSLLFNGEVASPSCLLIAYFFTNFITGGFIL